MAAENSDKPEWTFATPMCPPRELASIPRLDELYDRAIRTRESKRDMYEKALNAALENLVLWEMAARADGFEVKVLTDVHNGEPHPVFHPDGTVEFIQAYGVMVRDKEEK